MKNSWTLVIIYSLLIALGIADSSPVAAQDTVCSITVSDSNISVEGTDSSDVICIYGSNDVVTSLGGDDQVIDYGNQNEIYLGAGNDTFTASQNANGATIFGEDGNDVITGTPGEDEISGGLGNDSINGLAGDDTLIGGAGNDKLNGGLGADQLEGDAGKDLLFGEAGADQLDGGAGDDLLAGGSDVDDLAGGIGLNVCDYTSQEIRKSSCVYDNDPPKIESVSFSKTKLDSGSQARSLTITIKISDLSGIDRINVGCIPPIENEPSTMWWKHDNFGDSISFSGTDMAWVKDTTFKAQLTVPHQAASGKYSCFVFARDSLPSPYSHITNQDIQGITVTHTGPRRDDTGPKISEVNLSKKFIDSTTSNRNFEVSADVSDSSGVAHVMVSCSYDWTSSREMQKSEGQYRTVITVPKNTFTQSGGCTVRAEDKVGNQSESDWNDIDIKGKGANPADPMTQLNANPINIREFSFASESVDVGALDATVNLSATISYQYPVKGVDVYCSPAMSATVDVYTLHTHLTVSSNDGRTWSNPLPVKVLFGENPGTYHCLVVARENSHDSFTDASNYGTFADGTLDVYRTPPGLPSAPQNLSFTPNPDDVTQGVLSWDGPTFLGDPKLYGYVVQVSTDGTNYANVAKGATNATSIQIKNLSQSKSYWFRVRAENGSIKSQNTRYIQVPWVSLAQTAPSAPRQLSISKVTDRTFDLDWLVPGFSGFSALTNFKVELSKDGGSTWIPPLQSKSTSTHLSVKGAVPNSNYEIRVSAENAVGVSGYVLGHVETKIGAPLEPKDLYITNLTNNSATLGWRIPDSNGGSPIVDYQVEVSSDCSKFSIIKHEPTINLAFDVNNLKEGTNYCLRVSAINDSGVGTTSQITNLTTIGNVPDAPTNLGVKFVSGKVSLNWSEKPVNGGSPVRTYIVEVSLDGGATWSYVAKSDSSAKSIVLSGLKSKKKYQFRISAVNDVGKSEPSSLLRVTTL